MRALVLGFVLPVLLGGQDAPLRSGPFRAPLAWQTGYDQTGGVHLWGPNGLEAHGAYRFEDLCTPTPQPGLTACYRITVVLEDSLSGFAPDLIYQQPIQVWGDAAGHFFWQCGAWKLEMIAVDATIRQQVSWEAELKNYAPGDAGMQTVNVTVGRDSLTFLGRKPKS